MVMCSCLAGRDNRLTAKGQRNRTFGADPSLTAQKQCRPRHHAKAALSRGSSDNRHALGKDRIGPTQVVGSPLDLQARSGSCGIGGTASPE